MTMIDMFVQIVFGWSAILTSIVLSGMGVYKRKPALPGCAILTQ